MGFLKPEIVRGSWYLVDGPCGIDVIPAELVGDDVPLFTGEKREIPDKLRDYCQNREVWEVEKRDGYGFRMSAPGYLDCTEWAVYDSQEEAEAAAREAEEDE